MPGPSKKPNPRPDRRARGRRRDGRNGGLCGPCAIAAAAPPLRRTAGPFATDSAFVALIESVAAATTKSDTIDDALLACVEHVCRWTGWPVGHVYLAGKHDHDPLKPSHVWHLGHPTKFEAFRTLTECTNMPSGIGLPGRVAATGRPAWIVDVTCDPNFPRAEVAEQVGLKGAFCFPIPIGEHTFAVIECFSVQAVTPDDRLLEVTAHIGRQLGRVIAAAQLAEALRESESRFRSVAESATDAIIAADQVGDIISWNRGAELMFGYTEDEVRGKALSILMPERFRPMHDAGIERVAKGGLAASRLIGQTVEVVGLRKDGREFPLELSLAMWETAERRATSAASSATSPSARRPRRSCSAVLETAPDPIVEVGPDGTISLANARTDKLFGYDREQILGRPVEELFAERTRTLIAERFRAVLQSPARDSQVALGMGLELWGQRQDGTEFPVDVTVSPLATDDGTVLTAIIRDITERKRFETQLQHLADHDALTDLFNRRRFDQELAEFVAYAARYGGEGALLPARPGPLQVRQRHARPQGRRRGHPRRRPRAARQRAQDRRGRPPRRRRVRRAAARRRPRHRRAHRRGHARDDPRAARCRSRASAISMTTSIGIVCFGDEEPRVEDLMVSRRPRDVRGQGGRRQPLPRRHRRRRRVRERHAGPPQLGRPDPPRARRGPLRPLLPADPRARHRPGHPVRAAAAHDRRRRRDRHARRLHRHRGALRADPGDRPVGGHARRSSCSPSTTSASRSTSRGKSMGDLAIPELVEREIARTGIDPSRLVFEITETAAIANMEQARAFAERLTRLGCRFALDDFGAGFSSFYYLKYLPLDYLKIDGDFIRSLTSSVTDQLVVKSMVDIARGMGMKTIAEFVEAPETVAMLREKGVDYSQGYYHGAPRPVVTEFAQLEVPR